MIYARNTFVAVGSGNAILTSSDGSVWTDRFTFKHTQTTTIFLDAEALAYPRRFYRVVSP